MDIKKYDDFDIVDIAMITTDNTFEGNNEDDVENTIGMDGEEMINNVDESSLLDELDADITIDDDSDYDYTLDDIDYDESLDDATNILDMEAEDSREYLSKNDPADDSDGELIDYIMTTDIVDDDIVDDEGEE